MLRFRLRTLLIAVAVLAVPCAWVGYSLRWIEQRRSALSKWDFQTKSGFIGLYPVMPIMAPGGLWLLGERGVPMILCPPERAEFMRDLFPEAEVNPPPAEPAVRQ